MKANQAVYSVRRMCQLLGVSPSGYYASLSRPTSARERTDQVLRDRIVEIHHRSRGIYGAPRVHAELAAQDVRAGRKRVARLMQNANIQGVHRRRRISTTRRDPAKTAAPDLVERRFHTKGPNTLNSEQTPISTSTSATPKHHGSVEPRRTPTACSANTSPKEPISADTHETTWTLSPQL